MITTDVGAYIRGAGCGAVHATAGGAGDNTEKSGVWIDRQGFLSAKLIIVYEATLSEGKTLSITANLQDASTAAGTDAADYGEKFPTTVVATGGEDGGSTEVGVVELDFNLVEARRFVRAQFTPDLSATDTDVAIVAATLVLGGSDVVPPA